VEEYIRKITGFNEVGVDYFTFVFPLLDIKCNLDRFAKNIMPLLNRGRITCFNHVFLVFSRNMSKADRDRLQNSYIFAWG